MLPVQEMLPPIVLASISDAVLSSSGPVPLLSLRITLPVTLFPPNST